MRGPLVLLAAAWVLGGCTERFDGFTVTTPGVRSDVRVVPEEARRPDEIRFRIGPVRRELANGTFYVNPAGALLKVEGYLPLRPDEVDEVPDGFVVTMRLPRDRLQPFAVRQAVAMLYVPTETGEVAWHGLEHRRPGMIATSITLVPRQSGPVTDSIKRLGAFLHGLFGGY